MINADAEWFARYYNTSTKEFTMTPVVVWSDPDGAMVVDPSSGRLWRASAWDGSGVMEFQGIRYRPARFVVAATPGWVARFRIQGGEGRPSQVEVVDVVAWDCDSGPLLLDSDTGKIGSVKEWMSPFEEGDCELIAVERAER